MGWISVKDRLPEMGVEVLGCVPDGNGGYASIGSCYLDREGSIREYNEFEIYEITHWMPLPEPPTNEAKKETP